VKKKKLLKFIPARLRNRYGIGIGVFLLYVCFLSDYDLYTTLKLRAELSKKRGEHEQYARDIKTVRAELQELNGDLALLEKFAREKYKMKRDNEDVFVLVPKQ
jgi:cell division protein DivIC